MRFEGSFLQSKVARRVFALFVLSALVPTAFLSVFSYSQVTRLLTEQTGRELAVFSSLYGTAAYERLLLAERTLDSMIAQLGSDSRLAKAQELSRPMFHSLVSVPPSGGRRLLFGNALETGDLGRLDQAHLRRGEPLLETVRTGTGARSLAIVRLIDATDPQKGWIVAGVNPAFLWGNVEELPYQTGICVLDSRKDVLFCPNSDIHRAMVAMSGNTSSNTAGGVRGVFTLAAAGELHLAAVREVFVASRFGKQYWTVIASRPEAAALAPVAIFGAIFWGSVILSGLVVMLLSVSQIRRTLIPLESLMAAARRVAKRDFSTPVQVRRGDEFGDLADTFNYMTTRLDRQFNVLSALSRIDRSILSDLNVDHVVGEVLSRLPHLVQPDQAAIVVLRHESDSEGELHAAPPTNGRPAVFELEQTARQLLLSHPVGLWSNAEDAGALRQMFGSSGGGLCRLFVMPVMWQGRLCGAIALGWAREIVLEKEDEAYLHDFADRIGVALSSSAREARLFYQARYDALTDLPNRYLFTERLTQEIARAQRANQPLVLLFIALDRYKTVNDTMGHAAGDAVIREAALRLRKQLREGDTLCRFGGHEFAILLSGDIAPQHADVVARHAIAALAQPFEIRRVEAFLTASVGIALYPNDGNDAAELLRNADTACGRASGQQTFVYFTESMNQQALQRSTLERELRQAVERREFELYYQPKTDLQSGRMTGAEALIRWRHPQRGLVNPGEFISVAEETGLIVDMGRFALEEGCRQFREWRNRGIDLRHIAINVSGRQFQAGTVQADAGKAIREHGLGAGELELEVTESLMVDNFDEVARTLPELRGFGATIALDDFGTGYSSMSYLATLPFDTLKIDMAFIRPIRENGEGGALAAAIIAMAHSLQKKVVAEGVETQVHVDFLKRLGCHIAQGYFYSKPLPPVAFEVLYQQQNHLQ